MKKISLEQFAADLYFVSAGSKLVKCWYEGNSFPFDHPKNLSKIDICCALDIFYPSIDWFILCAPTSKSDLLSLLYQYRERYLVPLS